MTLAGRKHGRRNEIPGRFQRKIKDAKAVTNARNFARQRRRVRPLRRKRIQPHARHSAALARNQMTDAPCVLSRIVLPNKLGRSVMERFLGQHEGRVLGGFVGF